MKKTKRWWIPFREWGLDRKLVGVYAVMIILPVLMVTLLGFQRYEQNLTERVSEFGLNLTDQISANLDNYIRQIDRLSMTFYLDGVEGLSGKKDPMDLYNEKIAIDRALRNMMLIIPFQNIEGIYWIHDNDVQYSQYGSGKWIDHSGFRDEDWYGEVLAADGKGIVIPPYRSKYANGIADNDTYIFSYARSIINVSNRVPYGVLLIDLSTEYLYELLNEAKIKTSSTLFIVDEKGTIIYHPDDQFISTAFPVELAGGFGKFTTESINREPMMVQYVRSDVTGWTVVNTVPLRQLSDELSIIRNLLWGLSATALFLALVLSSAFTMMIIKPLKRMKRMMRKVELGDYSVRFRAYANDEIGQLGRSFNHMVEKINELVHRVLAMKIYQQQAEFEVLRSQINPHFLYNTLESISMKAEINRDYEVADMVALLGKLFRLSLQQNADYISFSRELEYVEVYMRLQQIRLPKMHYEIQFDQEVMNAYTLPWIIQPVVENAIIHGIVPAKGQGWIRIRGERSGGDIVITVEDNGCGIAPERLAFVNEQLRQNNRKPEGVRHIGLFNVHKRIVSIYGEGCGLSIRNRSDQGAIIAIRMKFRAEE
ncbi:sensor histidine kinase [Paenibacillus sp. J5C_2022]|uniref:cache domain-containing sensor histidine kinase n=1 Tax=Paenibacillus sp. J5C2022 TaxID=2977129 RepID=UPI0021D0F472|nr:sensor histidine kinase [Paenibacillus sp. J5C2022]MCU6711039.1 sensor histidine kinase [Paenibacillus sp. J5C2022]